MQDMRHVRPLQRKRDAAPDGVGPSAETATRPRGAANVGSRRARDQQRQGTRAVRIAPPVYHANTNALPAGKFGH